MSTVDTTVPYSHKITQLLSESLIRTRITELGQAITEHYQGTANLVIVGLLKGAFIFLADLCRAIEVPHKIEFLSVSSYHDHTESSGEVTIPDLIPGRVTGQHLLLVDELIDTGLTLYALKEKLLACNPLSISICTLLDKPKRRIVEVRVDWVGFTIPDEFVVGFGLDYAQAYRHLPFIGKVTLP